MSQSILGLQAPVASVAPIKSHQRRTRLNDPHPDLTVLIPLHGAPAALALIEATKQALHHLESLPNATPYFMLGSDLRYMCRM